LRPPAFAPQLKRGPLGGTRVPSIPESMTTFRYTSPWGFKEHQQALRAVSRVTLRRRPWLRAFRIAFPVLLTALVFLPSLLKGKTELNLVFFISALPWLLIIVLWIVLIRWGEFYLAARRTRRLDPSARGLLTRTFSQDGFRIDGTGQAGELQWSGVHSVIETPDFFLVFYNKLCGYYVPKHLIPAHDLEALRQLLRAKLGDLAQVGPVSPTRAA